MSQLLNNQNRSILKAVTTIEQFKISSDQIAPVYHDALTLPPFLNTNLRANDRKVKQFTGQHAVIQAFYFALMRLAFDLQDERDYATIVREVLIGDDEFGAGQLEDRDLSDEQYRHFLEQFMLILEQEGPFQQAIKPYPVIDSILLKMFKQLVPVTLQLRDESDQRVAERILSFLANKFQMRMEAVGGCFKLVEPDMFVYVSSLSLVYLVYVEELGDIKEQEDEDQSEGRNKSVVSAGNVSITKSGTSIQGKRQSRKSQGECKVERPKNFQTVINILESNKSLASKNSEVRHSIEGETKKAKIDSIKENIEEESHNFQESPSFFNRSSIRSPQMQPSVPFNPSSQPSSTHSSSSSQSTVTIQSQPSKTNSKPVINAVQSFQSSQSSFHSKLPSQFSSTPLKPSELRSYQGSTGEVKMIKTYGGVGHRKQEEHFSKFSSQIYKPSNLGIFSSVNPAKPPIADSQDSVCDDSGYQKFTNSKVLDLLDDQFRQQIKCIKKKYRTQRNNICKPL